MTMKKKLAITTMAASLVLGTLAGFPVINKGSVSTGVAYAATLPDATLLDKFNGIHAELAKDTVGQAAVRLARKKIDELSNNLGPEASLKKAQLIAPIWTRVIAKITNPPYPGNYSDINEAAIYNVFSKLAITYDSTGSDLTAALNNLSLRNTVNKLETLAGVAGGLNDITLNDFNLFYDAVINSLKTSSILVAASSDAPPYAPTKAAVKTAIDSVLSSNTNVSKVLTNLSITASDIMAVRDNFDAYADPQGQAKIATESAILRYIISTKSNYFDLSRSSDGRSLTPGFNVSNLPISNLLDWEVTSGSNVSFTNGSFVLANSVNTATIVGIAARDKIFHRLVYIGTISLTPQSTGGGGGGGGPVPGTDTTKDKVATDTKAALGDIKKQLQDATPEKQKELINQAKSKVEEAIKNISKIDLTKATTTNAAGDKATAVLNITDLKKQIEEINKQVKALNDSLKELDSTSKTVKAELALDLGTVNAKTTEVPLSKELLKAAKDNGIDAIGLTLNGLKMTLSSDEFKEDTTLNVTKQEKAVATSATQLQVASDVYEFQFASGGNKVDSFKTPISLSIPISNTSGMDTELLTLAKILDGKLIFFGGIYKNGKLDAKRNSFSTYTVVENKVSFNDTSSVQIWAGRQIQVAAAKGILEGRESSQFVPNGQVTRAEFAKMIVKTFGLEDASATASFNDVSDTDWYKVYVASAVKNGIVNGRAEGKFDPNGQITRAEMATMAARALLLSGSIANVTDIEAALKVFKDAGSIGDSLKSGVALAASQGIIVGEEGSQFNPNGVSTRAQAAVVIYRLLNK
ncbi:S-layer homology domain-containing protein [Paenibacillus sp. GP183]|uniref:S-layer homology domain-containing protein n=1 Tax=Paenibacillus sp. GP183 TaxID=1882751 RepID=UPI000896D84D|nr:S-layer homology domain-containing protein [Paenibacillus sp. GP183]SEC11501.1 S-layer homology domain-containing protein [Paenibacillus sp. GP183]